MNEADAMAWLPGGGADGGLELDGLQVGNVPGGAQAGRAHPGRA